MQCVENTSLLVKDLTRKTKEIGELEDSAALPTVVVEQIDGSQYTFDNASCALMFKKFNAVYGSRFGDQ